MSTESQDACTAQTSPVSATEWSSVPQPNPTSAEVPSTRPNADGWPIFLFFLVLLTRVWMVPYMIGCEDENKFTLPTIDFLKEHQIIPAYQINTTYLFPIQETLAYFLLIRHGAEPIPAIRFVVAVLLAFAVPIHYLNLRQGFSRQLSLFACLLFVFCNSCVAVFTFFSEGEYAFCILIHALLIRTTLYHLQQPSPKPMVALGLYTGLGLTVFKLCIFQVMVCWAVLAWYRIQLTPLVSEPFDSKYASQQEPGAQNSALHFSLPVQFSLRWPVLLMLGSILLGLGGYRRFVLYTWDGARQATTFWEDGLFIGGGLLWTVVLTACFWHYRRQWWPFWLPAALTFAIYIPVAVLYRQWYIAAYPPAEQAFAGLAGLKPWFAWPDQLARLTTEVWPALLLGNYQSLRLDKTITFAPLWQWLGLGILINVMTGLLLQSIHCRRWAVTGNSFTGVVQLPILNFLYIFPLILLTLVMLPSWFLLNDYSYRYYIPYGIGVYLFVGLLICRYAPSWLTTIGWLWIVYNILNFIVNLAIWPRFLL